MSIAIVTKSSSFGKLAEANPHKQKKTKKSKIPSHPPTSKMVIDAIGKLNEHRGSSLQAIKKFIQNSYNADIKKISFHIHKFLKSSVQAGRIIQTSGKGASGSFKLSQLEKKSFTALPETTTGLKLPQPQVKKKPISNKIKTTCTLYKKAGSRVSGGSKISPRSVSTTSKSSRSLNGTVSSNCAISASQNGRFKSIYETRAIKKTNIYYSE